jgi:hypothetical protein
VGSGPTPPDQGTFRPLNSKTPLPLPALHPTHRIDSRSTVSTIPYSKKHLPCFPTLIFSHFYPIRSWVSYGNKMLHNQFDGTVGFAIDGGVKDASHIRRLTAEHNSPMPAIDTAHHNLLTARALHTAQARTGTTSFPVLDWSALIAGTRVAAGLDAFDSEKARSSFKVRFVW